MLAIFSAGSGSKGKREEQIPEPDLIFKFWSNVLKTDSCWLWTKAKRKGYGQFVVNGKAQQAHRVAYQIANGSIDTKSVVMHKCDNPSCVNPAHLSLGTQKENIADMHNKGRAYIMSSISDVGKIVAIEAYKAGHKRIDIARYFGVHQTTITRLLKKNGISEQWKWNTKYLA